MNKRMINHSIILLLLFLLLLLQDKFASILRVSHWAPDFGLIFIFLISHLLKRRYAMIYAFIYGVLYDMNSSILGLMALSKSVSAYVAGFFEYDASYNHSNFVYGLLATAATSNFLNFTILSYAKKSFVSVLFEHIIPNTLYTLLMGTLIYFIFESFLKAIHEQRDQI